MRLRAERALVVIRLELRRAFHLARTAISALHRVICTQSFTAGQPLNPKAIMPHRWHRPCVKTARLSDAGHTSAMATQVTEISNSVLQPARSPATDLSSVRSQAVRSSHFHRRLHRTATPTASAADGDAAPTAPPACCRAPSGGCCSSRSSVRPHWRRTPTHAAAARSPPPPLTVGQWCQYRSPSHRR